MYQWSQLWNEIFKPSVSFFLIKPQSFRIFKLVLALLKPTDDHLPKSVNYDLKCDQKVINIYDLKKLVGLCGLYRPFWFFPSYPLGLGFITFNQDKKFSLWQDG